MERKTLENYFINDFENNLRLEEKANATVEKYIRDVTALSKYLSGKSITKELVIEYKQFLLNCGYAVRSVNSVIASLNSFFTYMGWFEFKLKTVKIQKQIYCSERKELSKVEYLRLINAAKRKGNNKLSLIIETIGATGIRISELSFITVEAVKKGEATVSLKGKTRHVFILKKLGEKLLRYIKQQKIKTGSIFITKTGKAMNRCNIWREMKKLCIEADVNPEKVFPHNLRHLFARVFYNIEKDIVKLADVLGHSSINTTRIYIIASGNEHRKLLEKMCMII